MIAPSSKEKIPSEGTVMTSKIAYKPEQNERQRMTSVCHFNLGHLSFPGCLILICLHKRIQDGSARLSLYVMACT